MKKRAQRKRASVKKISGTHEMTFWRIEGVIAFVVIFFLAFLALMASRPTGYASFPIDIRQGSQDVIKVITDFSQPFLEAILGVNAYDEYFFSKALLFVLLVVVIYGVLGKLSVFEGHPSASRILSVVVALLGVRYLISAEVISAVLLPYGTLAIAITVFLPFLIYFYFVHENVKGAVGRRAAWIAFGIFFIGLWIRRGEDVGSAGWMYLAGIIAVGAAMFFDPITHRYFTGREIDEVRRRMLEGQRRNILRNITELEDDYWKRHIIGTAEFKKLGAEYQKTLNELHSKLSKL